MGNAEWYINSVANVSFVFTAQNKRGLMGDAWDKICLRETQ